MRKGKRILAATLAMLAVVVLVGLYRSSAEEKGSAAEEKKTAEPPEAGAIRKVGEEYVKAFNKGDAEALSKMWLEDCEYVGPDGEVLHGRPAILKDYIDFFKKNPKARVELHVDTVRLLGRYTGLEEGRLQLHLPGSKEPSESRYRVVHVKDGDHWRIASVREWLPDASELVVLKDLEWLVGDWSARSAEGELRIQYGWDEDRAFLRARYTIESGGKVVSSGTQIIGKDPNGGLRSWLFDKSGTYGESAWTREAGRWVIEATGTLPDGSEVTATNVLVPLNRDSFTWQSIERTVGGVDLPATPPLKVMRVDAKP
jgi:uncharacterized protein (TIGR02246 family)